MNNLPGTSTGFQTAYAGGFEDGFLIRMSPDGAAVEYGTYLGGSGGDTPNAVAIRGAEAFVVGQTTLGRSSNHRRCVRSRRPFTCFQDTRRRCELGGCVRPAGIFGAGAGGRSVRTRQSCSPGPMAAASTRARREATASSTREPASLRASRCSTSPSIGTPRRCLCVNTAGVYKSVDAGASWLRTALTQQTTEYRGRREWNGDCRGLSRHVALDRRRRELAPWRWISRVRSRSWHIPSNPPRFMRPVPARASSESLDGGGSWAPIGGSNLPRFLGAVADRSARQRVCLSQ